jgi:hypothetical protein
MKICLFEGNTMSKMGQLVQELQENDDSFDGQGWIQSKDQDEKITGTIQATYTFTDGRTWSSRRASGEAGGRGSSGVRAERGGVQRGKD